jgi:exosortase N
MVLTYIKQRSRITVNDGLLAVHLAVMAFCLHGYLNVGSPWFILGLLAYPFILRNTGTPRFHKGYLFIAVLFLALCYPVPVKTFLFFSLSFSAFFLLEASGYRVGIAGWINLILLSPVFSSAANIFSFPIRLNITELAGDVLRWMEPGTAVLGNMIYFRGGSFSVDPACMGLNMLTASLIMGVLLLAMFGRKWKKELRSYQVLLFLAVVFVLNVVSNFMRILLLVLFNLLPGTVLHDVMGLVCLVIYVVLPSFLIVRVLFGRYGREISDAKTHVSKPPLALHLLLLACSLLAFGRISTTDTFRPFSASGTANVNGYTKTEYGPGIMKLESASALIYLKQLRGFYDSEHHPMLCWSGSGYEFSQVREEEMGGERIYTAVLSKGSDILYSAWWYGNGLHNTNEQAEWRWNMLRGQPRYFIINVSAADRKSLLAEVTAILQSNKLSPLLNGGR